MRFRMINVIPCNGGKWTVKQFRLLCSIIYFLKRVQFISIYNSTKTFLCDYSIIISAFPTISKKKIKKKHIRNIKANIKSMKKNDL